MKLPQELLAPTMGNLELRLRRLMESFRWSKLKMLIGARIWEFFFFFFMIMGLPRVLSICNNTLLFIQMLFTIYVFLNYLNKF